MTVIDNSVNTHNVLDSSSNEAAFGEWLRNVNCKGYSPKRIIGSLTEASNRMVKRNFSNQPIWEINSPDEFFFAHKKAIKDKIFCVITGHKNMPLFQLSSQLYFLFLKEISLLPKTPPENEEVCAVAKPVNTERIAIDPEDVISWLITQPNAEGSLYLERVARSYMGTLRNAPPRLEIPLETNKNVFECHSVSELDELVATFKVAPNYADINRTMGHGQLSAGLAAYRRYLEHAVITIESNIPTLPVIEDDEIRLAIDLTLLEKFANGFAYSSPIQIGRLKKFVCELIGRAITETDDAVITYTKKCGIDFDGKIYVVSQEVKEHIKHLADEYFSSGAEVIFYEALFEKHEQFLMNESIISEDMLKELFHRLYPCLYFNDIYFGHVLDNINVIITNEILRIWSNDGILTYSQIAERLIYIPFYRIKAIIGKNSEFIINKRGTGDNDGECIHISKIQITDTEKVIICDIIEKQCNLNRYMSLADLELNEIAEKNYGLSLSAIQTAVFQICCARTHYKRNGRIITFKSDNIDAFYIMKKFCQSQDKITLDELLAFEIELTGEQHRWIPMQAGYDTMVRINEQVFVADKYLDFDINAIDSAIEHFMNGNEYIPLQAITTFALFPYCGQTWNLFLLENYCRRFSPNFRFETRSVNSKNTGAIVRKNSQLTYNEIIIDFIARSNVQLTEQSILDNLFDNGLVSVRKHRDIENLIRIIRERRS